MAKKAYRSYGSVTKRGDTWRLRYPLPPDPKTGKRRWGSETVRGTKADAEIRLAEIRLANDPDGGMTLSQFWADCYKPSIRPLMETTKRSYEQVWRLYIRPAFGHMEIGSVRRPDVQKWLDTMSYGSARHALAVLRAMFTYAEGLGMISRNVARAKYRLPRKDTRAKPVNDGTHDRETLGAMLEAARGETWEACFILSAFGGLRREEAMGCAWSRVKWNEEGYALVTVDRSAVSIGKDAHLQRTKTEESARTVPIRPPYSTRLREIRAEYPADVWLADNGAGGLTSPNTLAKRYKDWHASRPFAYIPWKNLRKSYGSILHSEGVDLATISRLLGHTNIATTYSWYDRPSIDHFIDAVSVTKHGHIWSH